MRLERDAFLFDFAELCEREDLKSAGVGECGTAPAGEALQAAHGAHDAVAGAHMEMIGIAEHDLTADGFEIARGESALDRAGGCDVHEAGCLEVTVHGTEDAAAGGLFRFQQFKHAEILLFL